MNVLKKNLPRLPELSPPDLKRLQYLMLRNLNLRDRLGGRVESCISGLQAAVGSPLAGVQGAASSLVAKLREDVRLSGVLTPVVSTPPFPGL